MLSARPRPHAASQPLPPGSHGPDMQPRHFAPDIAGAWRQAIGPERERRAAPWRSLHDAGATLAFSSDWNVAEMDPLVGIYSALTRADLHGDDAWGTDQTVDLGTALGPTRWAAPSPSTATTAVVRSWSASRPT